MNDEQQKQNNLVNTTDCLEAVDVFRNWKNLLFTIIIICLLLLQAAFWAVNTKFVKIKPQVQTVTATTQQSTDKNTTEKEQPAAQAKITEPKQVKSPEAEKIKKAAEIVAAEPKQATQAQQKLKVPQVQEEQQKTFLRINVTFEHISRLINFADFVIIPAVVLYCMTLFFALKLSIVGRLGGINHICRAFFISLVMLVLILPWQRLFAGFFVGAMYSPCELSKAYSALDSKGIFGCAVYYLRFTGYWLLVLLLLIFAQIRSGRWSKAILRRLEVI